MYSYKKFPLLLAVIMSVSTVSPLFMATSASAQLFRSPKNRVTNSSFSTSTIPAGTKIPLRYEKAEKILVTKTETVPITLQIGANIKNRYGYLLVPYGAEVVGKIEPSGKGSRFVAEKIVFTDGRQQYLNGSSDIVVKTETVKKGASAGDILQGAAIGAAAATVVSVITGDKAIATEEVLGGGVLGAVGGWLLGGSTAELISISPSNGDLDLVLSTDLALNR